LDHCHEKLFNISADYTEFIKHVETRINISSGDNVTLLKEISHADTILGTQDDSTSINRKRKKTDNNATLPEKFSKLIFNLYSISYINYSG